MKATQAPFATTDDYIATTAPEVQTILEHIRRLIHEIVPEAEETISYAMPTFTLNGHYLVYFAAYKKHIGLYPSPTGVEQFQEDLARYGAGKGTLKFPLDQPMPFDLIRRFVAFRAQEVAQSAASNKKM